MGGCRCSYRNCSLRSDGKTHMFHYPVFDKVRCHQWLTNAHKLEFLNLKVSQLKNRVVCQHHFREDNFMNFKKDKLTFDAVPTENGPYCDSSQWEETKPEPDDTKGYSISLDDIENEYLTIIDKKANFSVKYGDFLTNCDVMDLNSLGQINTTSDVSYKTPKVKDSYSKPSFQKISQIPQDLPSGLTKSITYLDTEKVFEEPTNNIFNDNANRENTVYAPLSHVKTFGNINKSDKQQEVHQIDSQVTYNVSTVPIEFDQSNLNEQNQLYTGQPFEVKILDNTNQANEIYNESFLKTKKKIRIISEKNIKHLPQICKPDPDQLEPVSLNRVLTLPNRNKNANWNRINITPAVSTINDNEIIGGQIDNMTNDVLFGNNTNIQEILVELPNDSTKTVALDQPSNIEKDHTTTIQEMHVGVTENFTRNDIFDKPENIQEIHIEKKDNLKNDVVTYKKTKQTTASKKIYEDGSVSSVKNSDNLLNENNYEVSPKASLLKNKIPPERVAAIAEKRKFNMRLRDIVEDSLNKLDESEIPVNTNKKNKHKSSEILTKHREVSSHLAKKPELPNLEQYTIAYLEAKMKKMENILINKIDQNSQRISELKEVVAPSRDKKSVHTQTSVNEVQHKKQLYQEISKYLSEEASSSLYEELFINKYKLKLPKSSPSAKRRRKYR